MKRLIILIITVFGVNTSFGQTIATGVGFFWQNYKRIVPIKNQIPVDEFVPDQKYFDFVFDENDKGWTYGFSYNHLRGWTIFDISNENGSFGLGTRRTFIHRLGFSCFRNLLDLKRNIKFSPFATMYLEYSKVNKYVQSGNFAYVGDHLHPDYEGTLSYEAIPRFQINPVIGVEFTWNFWYRFSFVTRASYSQGFRPFQRIFFDYKYQGIQQPIGIIESNGSGQIISFMLAYRFGKTI